MSGESKGREPRCVPGESTAAAPVPGLWPVSAKDFSWLLASLCEIQRIPFDDGLVRGQFPAPHRVLGVVDAATRLGFRCELRSQRVDDIERWAFPCFAFLHPADGDEAGTPRPALVASGPCLRRNLSVRQERLGRRRSGARLGSRSRWRRERGESACGGSNLVRKRGRQGRRPLRPSETGTPAHHSGQGRCDRHPARRIWCDRDRRDDGQARASLPKTQRSV
jgi:hypothetical protein